MLIQKLNKNSKEEFLRLYEVFKEAYTIEAQLLCILPDQFFPLQQTLNDIESSTDEIYILKIESILVGAIFLEKADASITISNLIVDPNFFRRGIAKTLVDHVLRSYSSMAFYVGTAVQNIPAIQLYKKFGFQPFIEGVVEPNIKVVKMQRYPPPIFIDAPFNLNRKNYPGFKVIYSAQKHLLDQGQPGLQSIEEIFKKIAKSLDGRTLEPKEFDKDGRPIYLLASCTADVVGFSTENRSTLINDNDRSDYMLVPHHSPRNDNWYKKNKKD